MNILRFDLSFPGETSCTQLLALEGDEFVGTVTLRHRGQQVADLSRLFVAVNHRRKGVARRLIDMATEIALESSCEAMSLYVKPANAIAIGLYRATGFALTYKWPDGDLLFTRTLAPFAAPKPAA